MRVARISRMRSEKTRGLRSTNASCSGGMPPNGAAYVHTKGWPTTQAPKSINLAR